MRLSEGKRRLALALVAAVACAGATLLVIALVEGDGAGDRGSPAGDPAGAGAAPPADGTPGEPGGEEPAAEGEGASGGGRAAGPGDRRQRLAERAVREYVAALTAGDGDRVCELLVPGAIEAVDLPAGGGDCGEALTASIGYRDPRGFPQFERARVAGVRSVEVNGNEARVTATVVTDFADREQPSIEEDVVYLERRGGELLLAQPSATLYRAIGAAEVPPRALAPPPG